MQDWIMQGPCEETGLTYMIVQELTPLLADRGEGGEGGNV